MDLVVLLLATQHQFIGQFDCHCAALGSIEGRVKNQRLQLPLSLLVLIIEQSMQVHFGVGIYKLRRYCDELHLKFPFAIIIQRSLITRNIEGDSNWFVFTCSYFKRDAFNETIDIGRLLLLKDYLQRTVVLNVGVNCAHVQLELSRNYLSDIVLDQGSVVVKGYFALEVRLHLLS